MVKITDPTKTCSKCNKHVTDAHYQRGTPVWIKSKEGDGLWCKPCYDHWRLGQPKALAQKRSYMNEYRQDPEIREKTIQYLRDYRRDPERLRKHKEYMEDYYDKSIRYKGKSIFFDHKVRTGVCSRCGGVSGRDVPMTQLHHDENQYDDKEPLKHTVELCAGCHAAETNRLRYLKKVKALGELRCGRCNKSETRVRPSGTPVWLFNKHGYNILCSRCYDHFRHRR